VQYVRRREAVAAVGIRRHSLCRFAVVVVKLEIVGIVSLGGVVERWVDGRFFVLERS
jgi:hypothetical protein